MEITITKSDFEQALPVGAAANDSVYESVKPAIERQLSFSKDVLLGVAGMQRMEDLGEGSSLVNWFKQLVCLSAFLSMLRQLDLVLTPTGFGVVSNDNIAPASQFRVDALERELTYRRDMARHNMINELRRVDGWAETEQALDNIRSFFWSPVLLRQYYYIDHKPTFDDLASFRSNIDTAENFLRKQLSDDLIDQLLSEERKAKFEPNHRAAKLKILDFIALFLPQNGDITDRQDTHGSFENLLRFIEDHLDDFTKYRDSTAYKANHMQAYENKADDTTFFFAG